MAYRSLFCSTIDRCNVAENLGLLSRSVRSYWEIFKLLQILHVVLRSLHRDVVAHMILGIQIERWRGLETSTQAGEETLCYIPLTIPNLLRASPVDVDRPLRQVERLLNSEVRSARYVAYLYEPHLRLPRGGTVPA